MTFSNKRHPQPTLSLFLNNIKIYEIQNHEHLVIHLDTKAAWHARLKFMIDKLSPTVYCFRSTDHLEKRWQMSALLLCGQYWIVATRLGQAVLNIVLLP